MPPRSTRFRSGADPSVQATERVDLVFDGIDTVATVRLRNGNETVELGRTFNMHRSYRFDITPQLRDRSVTLEVDLHSATAFATAEQQRLGDPAQGVPGAVQLRPEDGLQLRLGLGARPAYRGPVETGPGGAVEHRPAGAGATSDHRRRRRHRSGRAARRARAPRHRDPADASRGRAGPRGGGDRANQERVRRSSWWRCRMPPCGGRWATASSRWPTSRSSCRRRTGNSIAGSAASGSVPSPSTPARTRSAARSPWP